MTLKPYNTKLKLIMTAQKQGHIVVSEDKKRMKIDTGDELITVSADGVTKRSGAKITIDAAMDIILAKPEE